MNNDNLDKEIQEALDNNLINGKSSQDAKAYIKLYDILNDSSVDEYLPKSFADNIVTKVTLAKSDWEANWWLGSIIVLMIFSALIVTVMTLGIMNIEIGSFFGKYFPMMSLVTFIIVVVQYLDKRLIKLQV
jgi:hypothetical protein